MHSFARLCGTATLATLTAFNALADQKTLTEYSSGDSPANRVRLYQKGALQRTDVNDRHAVITRPEAMIMLDLEKKTFMKTASSGSGTATPVSASRPAAPTADVETRKGGIVKTRVAIEDTGERKQVFGYEARRLKMRTEMLAGPDTCHPGDMRMETDGWYIDLKEKHEPRANGGQAASAGTGGGCKDEYQSEYSGSGKTGFPVEYHSRTWQNGQGPHITSMKVIELSQEELNASLFDIPEGFTDGTAVQTAVKTPAALAATPQGAPAAGGILVGVAPVRNATGDAPARLAAHLSAESVTSIPLTDASLDTARKAGVAYVVNAEQAAAEGKKRGGMFSKLSQAVNGKEVELRYTLVAVSDGRELLRSSAVSRAGGSGFGAALGIASAAVPAAGTGRAGLVAQTVVNTAAAGVNNASLSNLPVSGLLGNHSHAAYSGMMDPNLHSLAYMSRYSASMAAAQAAGMAANAAMSSAAGPNLPAVDEGQEGTLDNAMRQAARAVRKTLNR
ncbi:MAG TPA: hypothetical protein VES20_09760 [Bryobacteraceae bacterium]|nr:hypothetical protein [Bryobacteraceae bacterium]